MNRVEEKAGRVVWGPFGAGQTLIEGCGLVPLEIATLPSPHDPSQLAPQPAQ